MLPLLASQAYLLAQTMPFFAGVDVQQTEKYHPATFPVLFLLPYRNRLMGGQHHQEPGGKPG